MAVVERRHHGHSYFRAGGAAWSRDCRIDDGGGGAAARGGVCLVTATVKREFSVAGEYRYDLAGPVRRPGPGREVMVIHRPTGAAGLASPASRRLWEAAGARYCAFPAALPWLSDEDWRSLMRPPLYPDFLVMPEKELPQSISTPFRLIRLTGQRAILTVLPVKSSPTEVGYDRHEHELKMDYLRKCKALGEKYYDQMYETSFGATGLYSDAKDAFRDAIMTARELGLKAEVEELEKRLDHIKAVFRSQF